MKYLYCFLLLLAGCAKNVPATYNISNYNLSVTASEAIGGAINSIQYKGLEYINAADTGRGVQTTVRDSRVNEFWNPTEGGAVSDGLNSKTLVLNTNVTDYSMRIKNQWAFWVGIDDKPTPLCFGPFRAQSSISNVTMDKTISINNNVITINKSIYINYDLEVNLSAEMNVIYMVNALNTHYAYDPSNRTIAPLKLSDTNPQPVIISASSDGRQAIAQFIINNDPKITKIFSAVSGMNDGYGDGKVYWSDFVGTFAKAKNGTYTFTTYIIVGDLNEVLNTLAKFNF